MELNTLCLVSHTNVGQASVPAPMLTNEPITIFPETDISLFGEVIIVEHIPEKPLQTPIRDKITINDCNYTDDKITYDDVIKEPNVALWDSLELRALRDGKNVSRAEQSMDDHKLRELFRVFGDDDDKHANIPQLSNATSMSDINTSSNNVIITNVEQVKVIGSPNTESENCDRKTPIRSPLSPITTGRKKVGLPITPSLRSSVAMSIQPHGSLNDFIDDGEPATPTTDSNNRRSTSISSLDRKSPQKVNNDENPSCFSLSPAAKRGFLKQVDSEMVSTPSRAYHVLDNGTLYQVDARTCGGILSMGNRAISLRHASLTVHDDVIDVISDEVTEVMTATPVGVISPSSAGHGQLKVSFEVKDEAQREQWVDALKQHIEFSETTTVV
jgi:hypothetical protein